MKNTLKNNSLKVLLWTLLALILTSCGDLLENPLKDKETGDDINLLILDFNFFNTRMTYKFLDAADGSVITAPATITFTGADSDNIVTFSGEKRQAFITTEGQLELTIDPNFSITENTPFDFAITVVVDGYNTMSKGLQFKSEGKKTIELRLSKISDENSDDLNGDVTIINGDTTIVFSTIQKGILKSGLVEAKPYKISYELSISDFLKLTDTNGDSLFHNSVEVVEAYNSDPDNFSKMSVKTYTGHEPGVELIEQNGALISVLFHKLETGRLDQLLVTGRVVARLNGALIVSNSTFLDEPEPDIFGFAEFEETSWKILGTQNVYDNLEFKYTLVKASEETLCETGASINFSSDVISSFSIDADIYDDLDNFISTITFKGNFPETFVLENVPSRAGKLVFRDNNPSFETLPPKIIDNFCEGSYNVVVTPSPGFSQYQIVLKAFCPDNPTIAVAPTYSGEVKISTSDSPWQGVDMIGGVVDLLGLPNQEYQLRILWEDAWEYTTFYTEFDENGNYLHPSESKVKSEILEDGRIRINIEKTFSQNVCDDLNW